MKWILKKFKQLSLDEFHDILQLRINVFVVEQDCPYPELDDKDKKALHFFGLDDSNKIIAYTRIFKPGDYYDEAAFGRVLVHKDYRRNKLGHTLIRKTIEATYNMIGVTVIKIGAQTYLQKFYESFGFEQIGEEYLEDGIPHIHMIKG